VSFRGTDALADLFPHTDRVLYLKPPLVQVTCQLRFPPLLRLETSPVDFQERIRSRFPLLERPTNFGFPQQLPPEVLQALAAQIGFPGWRFLTEDRKSTMALSPESLALTTTAYTRWEEFLDQLRPALSGLIAVYAPGYFSRVSLRYQDFIQREKIGLDGEPWSQLLRRELLGEAAIPEIEQHMEQSTRVLRLRMPKDGGVFVLQHALAKPANSDQGPVGYIIDLDFAATAKTEVTDAEAALTKLHSHVRNAFRWCITDRLHNALEPTALDDVGR
jgi:uncharacterized protein (TIGR04255 family)